MHLNLQLQKTFIPAIEEVFPLVQFIITTQSPFTVQSMSTNNVFILENMNGKVLINTFFESGKPWAWSLTDILNRLVGQSSEISAKLDKKMTDYQRAKRDGNKAQADFIYAELMKALPLNSPLIAYVESL